LKTYSALIKETFKRSGLFSIFLLFNKSSYERLLKIMIICTSFGGTVSMAVYS
jgi:hypothetical protein